MENPCRLGKVFQEFLKKVPVRPPASELIVGATWKIDIDSNNPELVSEETKPQDVFRKFNSTKKMKKAGIGRPSAYVSMVQKLQEKKYVENINGSLIPTKAVEGYG